MGGDGGYGGNGSVHWSIHHRDRGGPVRPNNKNGTGNPKADHWIDLGVAGNVPAQMGDEIAGHDPTAVADIGNGSGRFRVNLLLSTDAAPKADLQAILIKLIADASAQLAALQGKATKASLEIEVPAINRSSPPTGRPGDPWEITVVW
jgi:hypothetical protein